MHKHQGATFGLLTCVEWVGRQRWRCRCQCGGEKVVFESALRSLPCPHCGCISIARHQAEQARKVALQEARLLARCLRPCLDCGMAVGEPCRLYCAPCSDARRAMYGKRPRARANVIGCHGQWHLITALPWGCVRCRRVYGE